MTGFKSKVLSKDWDMGLDQYAYVASKADTDYNDHSRQKLAYWRKHPNLQGWMEQLWEEKGRPGIYGTGQVNEYDGVFNGIEVELTWDDVDKLERDIKSGAVSNLGTTGFFFGNPSDDYYYEDDLKFCIDAKAELFLGRKVFYNSSW
jgi:hypothetical protein